jgi:hypothetical protein
MKKEGSFLSVCLLFSSALKEIFYRRYMYFRGGGGVGNEKYGLKQPNREFRPYFRPRGRVGNEKTRPKTSKPRI